MIKAVVFDLNGVLIQSPYLSSRLAQKYGFDEKEFLKGLKKIFDIIRRPNAGDMFQYWVAASEEVWRGYGKRRVL